MKRSLVFSVARERLRYSTEKKREELSTFFRDYSALTLLTLSATFLFLSLLLYITFIRIQPLRVTFFDVGQGDGILIESPSGTRVFIDGGPSLLIQKKLANKLSLFDRRIDLLAPTHADKDHVLGSIAVGEKFPVSRSALLHASSATVLDDEYMQVTEGSERLSLTSLDKIDIGGGAEITVLLPKKSEHFSEKETNESSQVLLLSYEGYTFLLTGDLGVEREEILLAQGLLPHVVTVLKAGHHGSKGSSGSALLSYTQPNYVIVSAGKDNRYGHPAKEMLERAEKVKAIVLSTIESGDITFSISDGEMKVETGR